jgi:hypothetical protein
LRQLIEGHLERVGTFRTVLLLGTAFVWAAIGVAIVLYSVLTAAGIVWTWTRDALAGDAVRIALAAVLWTFVALSAMLGFAGRDVLRHWQRRRWDADAALDRLEAAASSRDRGTGYLDSPRERLATRAIEHLERDVFGSAKDADMALEQRLIELDAARSGGEPVPSQDDSPD